MLSELLVSAVMLFGQAPVTPPWEVPAAASAEQAPAVLPEGVPAEVALPSPAQVLITDSAAAPNAPERWLIMRALSGTRVGDAMERQRFSVSGWFEGAYTATSATANTFPIGFNDRGNTYDVHQVWARLDRSLAYDSDRASVGGRIDFLYGSDYRFTLMRGLLNYQLVNPAGGANMYGYDVPQFYGNVYLPNVLRGLEVRVGRFFSLLGYESVEAPTTPLLSRSYGFVYTPFTHFGVLGILNVTNQLQVSGGTVAGNDVFVGDPSQQWRFIGSTVLSSQNKRASLKVAWTLGEGAFDVNFPFATTTPASINEPFGHNNVQVVDITATAKLTERLRTAVDGVIGWQFAPAGVPGFPNDHALFSSVAGYLFFALTPKIDLVARGESFLDYQGQRTGTPGAYTAFTLGVPVMPKPGLIFRPEVRFDWHGSNNPPVFNGGADQFLFTTALDMIVRF